MSCMYMLKIDRNSRGISTELRFWFWEMLLELLDLDDASGGKTAPAFWPFLKTHIFYPPRAHRTLRHWVGGVGMLPFMLTCVTCTSYVTSMGWGDGDVNVHVNLRHMHNAHRTLRHWVWGVGVLTSMLTCVTGTSDVTSLGWGVGMLTFMWTCITCTSYVTSLDWRGGDVNVHVNLRHMHIVR